MTWPDDSIRILDEVLEMSRAKREPTRRPFRMVCNGYPQLIGGTPYIVRMSNPSGFQGGAHGFVTVEPHLDLRLTTITIDATVTTQGGRYRSQHVHTFHAPALKPANFTWHVFGLQARRETRKGGSRVGPAAFRFDLFTPVVI